MLTVVLRKNYINNYEKIFNVEFDMLADMDFVLRFSQKWEFDCVQKPIAVSRQHQNQLQNKNLKKQSIQMSKWYEKIKITREFGDEKKLINIKNRCNFFNIINSINEKQYKKSIKEILLHPNYIEKIKLLLMLFLPSKVFNKIINLR